MSADSYNSDDERYADETFEQESDTDVPEAVEIESEISEASDADQDDESLPTAKINTGPIRRNSNLNNIVVSASNHTDAVPFDSSSDEEDDVIVGQTMAEINTPSMHFESERSSSPPLTGKLRQLHDESRERLKSLDDEQSDASSVYEEEADEFSEDEREFQRIRDMEERYLLQNSAKATPKTGSGDRPAIGQKTSQSLESKKTQEKAEDEIVDEKESKETEMETKQSDIDPIPELIEKVMEQFTPKPQVPPQIQTDFMEIVQNSLKSFQNDALANAQVDTITTDDLPTPLMADESIRMTFSFEPNHILNPENIAKAFFDAMSSTNITFASGNPDSLSNTEAPEEKLGENPPPTSGSNSTLNAQQNASIDEPNDDDKYEDLEHGDKEVELEHIGNASPSPVQPDEHNYDDADDYDNESYYDTQFEYQITSKTPSCFNSDDYVFHANFIRPTPTTDKLRVRSHPRKSMSFSNERMREIERHNQILLRKILTQKPTYTAKSAQNKVQPNKTNSQTQVRLTTSAVNRKKQQRQIDMDNQVLKRKIEAISLRRRPLIS